MSLRLESVTLEGESVRLTPLTREGLPELTRAVLSAPEVFQHIPFSMREEHEVRAILENALAAQREGSRAPFVTRLGASGELVGSTSLYVTNEAVPTVEIGFTWILPAWQRTAVNTEAKLLQLRHCFDALGCQRVELKTDIRNLRSRAAIARLGAREEGVLRAHMRRADGSLRDTVMFSIVASEWPEVRERLQQRLRGTAAAGAG